MDTALNFYREQLGFDLAFTSGEPVFYAQVKRGGAMLNLRHADRPAFDAEFKAQEGDVLSATITLDVAKPLYAEFERKGVAFAQTLRTEPWGAVTFIVADPDGNLICFAASA